MSKTLTIVLIVCALIITGSISVYYLYVLPQFEVYKFENTQLKEDLAKTSIDAKEQVEAKTVVLKEPVSSKHSNEDPALVIEKCKVNTTTVAKAKATKTKEDYVYQQTIAQNNCNQSLGADASRALAEVQASLASYEARYEEAKEQNDKDAMSVASTKIQETKNRLLMFQNQLSNVKASCLSGILSAADGLYNEVYNKEYDNAYQACINSN